MIRVNVRQGSPEWTAARLAMPTASQFHRIITAKTRKLSTQADAYMHELLAEWLLGEPLDSVNSPYMQRGTELEDSGVAYYEFATNIATDQVGFITRDDGLVGCSPDRLVGSDGGLEIKVPGAAKHVGHMLGGLDDYTVQVHGCMWICERQWWDVLSFNPCLPCVMMRIKRDQELIDNLSDAVDEFLERMTGAKQRLIALGCVPVIAGVKETANDDNPEAQSQTNIHFH